MSDPVTAWRHGLDHRWVAKLDAQAADRHLDCAGELIGHLVPHPVKQVADGENASLSGEQAFQDRELLGAERELSACPGCYPAAGIHGEVTMYQRRGLGGCGAAAERLDPGHEFGEGERLGQVIVGAEA